MKINSIKLKNIGPYKGVNEFRLDNANVKGSNITLIGGKNGTGKTTFLKAIKVGLFGCFSFGFKNANSSYFKEVLNLLNNNCNENAEYFIEINFSFTEGYKTQEYSLHREWKKCENEIVENVFALKNGCKISEYDTLELENKLKSLTSPALINSFIYDGEKISSIIEQGQLEVYIKEMFNSIFNINLIDQLFLDLTNYMIKSYRQDNKSIEYELSQTLNSITFIKSELKTNENYAINISKDIENLKIEISDKKKEFATLGGLSKEDINRFSQLVVEAEKKKEENNSFVKNLTEDYLHLIMVLDELKQVVKKAKAEMPLRYAKQLEVIQNYLKTDFSKYIECLNSKAKTSIFNLDEYEIEGISNLVKVLNNIKSKSKAILSDKNSIYESLTDMRDRIDKNSTMSKLVDLPNEIEELQNKLTNRKEELGKLNLILKEKNQEKENLIKKYNNIAESVRKDKLANSSYVQCTNALILCEEFKNRIINMKLELVSKNACDIFNKTIRKKNYISEMRFDKNFSFKLYNGNGKMISPLLLSAGEMQILVSSLIWAMFKVSGRKEMFVFDTPLARLDRENRIQFIKNIISTISEQVIILSTDSEFIGENLKSIEGKLCNRYLLEYNDRTKTTKISHQYFGEGK